MSDPLVQTNSPLYPVLSPRRIWLLAIMAVVPLVVQLVTPMSGDLRDIYGNAFLSSQVGSFPGNISHFLCFRGFGYKCLIYGLYRTAELVVDSRSIFTFELITRGIYYSGYVLLSVWFFWLLRGRLAAFGLHWLEAMFLFLVGILATSHHIHQQPEELAMLLTVGLTAFSLSDNKTLNCLSGLFIPLLLLCKIITIWPAVFPFAMILATRDRSRILRTGVSWAVFFAATILFYIVAIPQEIADTRAAAMSQSHFCFAPRDLQVCVYKGVWAIAHIPFYLVTVVCVGYFLWRGWDEGRWKEFLLALGSLAVALPPIVLQSLHLPYHYLQFFPAAFLIALWSIRSTPDIGRRSRLLLGMAGVTFAGTLFFSTIPINKDAYLWLCVKGTWHENAALQKLDRQFHLSQEPELLFLSSGEVNYVIRTKSYSRYYGPVLLQRAKSHKSIRDTELFHRMLDDALSYHGTYIFFLDWIPLDYLPQLEAKLKNEYEPACPEIEECWPYQKAQLYRRKDAISK
jgi:hypothetical protein